MRFAVCGDIVLFPDEAQVATLFGTCLSVDRGLAV
jgi:hypothetical protein